MTRDELTTLISAAATKAGFSLSTRNQARAEHPYHVKARKGAKTIVIQIQGRDIAGIGDFGNFTDRMNQLAQAPGTKYFILFSTDQNGKQKKDFSQDAIRGAAPEVVIIEENHDFSCLFM